MICDADEIALFKKDPGAAVLSVDGVMIDAPHLQYARGTLSRLDD